MEIPMIRLTIESMRHEIVQAFTAYVDGLKNEVARVVENVINTFNYEAEIRKIAEVELRKMIESSIKFAMWEFGRDNDVKSMLVKAFKKSMKE